jgi:PAS domain S-box-containing protein
MNSRSQLTDLPKAQKEDFLNSLQKRQSELVEEVSKTLISKAFENRYTLHPRRLKEIAADEVEIFIHFFSTLDVEAISEHGKKRSIEGLGERPLLALCKIFQKYSLAISKDQNYDSLHYAIETIDSFMQTYLYGYMTERIKQTLTDQEQMRRALSTSLEQKTQDLFIKNFAIHTYINGIILTDLDGKITYLNPAFMKMWGYDNFDEVLKTDNSKFLGVEDFNELLGSLSESEGWQNEFKAVRTDGSTFDVAVSVSLIQDEKLQPVGTMTSFIDVTERKRLETQLRQAQKMEAMGTLAGGIAHDFNNILSSVIGYTEIALDDVPKESVLHNNLQEVFQAGVRARGLVKQIIAFSRQSDLEKKALEISPLVKEALKFMRASIPTTIDIHENIETGLHPVLTDPTQIDQILMNLCTNAAHAMQEKGGTLEVSLTNVTLADSDFKSRHSDMSPGPYLRLSISDTGHGMSPNVLERIFDPYYTTKEMGEGTGLGLAVVHGIVKSLDGTITVYSERGKGSTFNVYLPAITSDVEPEFKAVEPIPTGNERILFIDDEQPIVNLAKQVLERLGYDVVTKTDSIEALKLIQANPAEFDLVITDLTMPNMAGDALAQEIMRIRPDVPIILCTGFSKRLSEEKAKALGIRAFVNKPILKPEIADTVRKVLDEN